MKTIDEYMKMPYKLEIVPDSEETGFIASYPDLPGCITLVQQLQMQLIMPKTQKGNGSWLQLKKILKSQNQKVQILIPGNLSSVFQNLCIRLLPKILKKKE